MRRKDVAVVDVRAWERRYYWRKGTIVDVEVWHSGRLMLRTPRRKPGTMREADYCGLHRTRIFPDLPCQFCGERPGPSVAVLAEDDAAIIHPDAPTSPEPLNLDDEQTAGD